MISHTSRIKLVAGEAATSLGKIRWSGVVDFLRDSSFVFWK